jgi:hypothetical protein
MNMVTSSDGSTIAFDRLGEGPAISLVGDDTLTIWGGFVGSPANFKGRFSDGGRRCSGRWEWPGGGYEATMTRSEPQESRSP